MAVLLRLLGVVWELGISNMQQKTYGILILFINVLEPFYFWLSINMLDRT